VDSNKGKVGKNNLKMKLI